RWPRSPGPASVPAAVVRVGKQGARCRDRRTAARSSPARPAPTAAAAEPGAARRALTIPVPVVAAGTHRAPRSPTHRPAAPTRAGARERAAAVTSPAGPAARPAATAAAGQRCVAAPAVVATTAAAPAKPATT